MLRRLLLSATIVLVMLGAGTTAAYASAGGVHIMMEELTEGRNNVLIPSLSGHTDAALQEEINRQIADRLQIDDLLRALERSRSWTNESDAPSIRMEVKTENIGAILSLAASVQGALPDGSNGHMYATYACDLLAGQEILLGDLFDSYADAVAHMESIAYDTLEREGYNAYLDKAVLTPLPERCFSLGRRGLTIYYPREQYQLANGKCGAFLFPYYQIEAYLRKSSVTETLLHQQPAPDDPAAQIRSDVEAGNLPGIPASLGEPMAGYIERFGLQTEPDYTLTGPLYQFETPIMQGVRLSSATFPEDPEDTSEPIVNIRATVIDLYGLRPGLSTLQDALDLLGAPDETTVLDAEEACDMLLPEGVSLWYRARKNRLELHFDEQSALFAVILHASD